jgi:enoyl-CoA hydratase
MQNGTPVEVTWDGAICRVILNRPDKLNALHPDVLHGLIDVAAEVRARPEVRVVLLSGAGRVFCAGADLEYIYSIFRDAEVSRRYLYLLRDAILGLEDLPVPVIAVVHGVVLAGGLELMLGCDLVLAAESTRIGDQHMNYGFIPGGGSTQRLPRWVGPMRARDLLFTGRWLTAREAWEIGLVSRVIADAELAEAATTLADDLATRSPAAMRQTKALARSATAANFREGIDREVEAVLAYYVEPEFAASLEAFRDRKSGRS